ncbi:MAG: tetratricopeptide repeat protein [Hyphomicrobiaceae bacterium]|nr:tetratricopeptide repeat protein [Hyphomicrobiaceae bacterium]MCC0022651.1 tetratricopeptide repeat protein [Hyphomicrobiaceae bacterium]
MNLFGDGDAFGPDGARLPHHGRFMLLLAFLALAPQARAKRGDVAAFLWPASDEKRARNNLRQRLHQFRNVEMAAGVEIVGGDREWIWLNRAAVRIDFETFEAGGTPGWVDNKPPAPFELLHGAEAVFEDRVPDWLRQQRRNVNRRMLESAKGRLMRRDDKLALAVIERLWRGDPYQEDLLRDLLSLTAQWRGWTEAKPLFDDFCEILASELGETPSPQTRLLVASLSSRTQISAKSEGPAARDPAPSARVLLIQRYAHEGARTPSERLSDLLLSDLVANVSQSPELLCSRVVLPVGAPAPNRSGFDFVLDLTCASMADRYYLTWLLEEATNDIIVDSGHDWLRRPDLIELYDHVLNRMTRRVNRGISDFRHTRKFTPSTTSFTYASFLRLRDRIGSCFDLVDLRSARKKLVDTMKDDPDFIPGQAALARSYSQEWLLMQGLDKSKVGHARDIAQELIDAHPDDPAGHNEAGHAYLHLGDIDRALEHQQRALDLSPNASQFRADFADALSHAGHLTEALDQIEVAISEHAITPDDYLWIKASILFFREDFDAAQASLKQMRDQDAALRMRAACAVGVGHLAEARKLRARSMEIYPDFRLETYARMVPAARPDLLDAYVSALRSAGFP